MPFETMEPKTVWRTALATAAAGVMLLAGTTPVFAQKVGPPSWVFEGFAARKDPAKGPVFGGISLTSYHRILGLRLGGAAHFDGGNTQPVCDRFGCQDPLNISLTTWTADADLLVEPLRVIPFLRKLLLGFSPYGFVGIGGYGVRVNSATDTSIATYSYGAGVHHNLFGPLLGIQAEARYREPLQGNNMSNTVMPTHLAYSVGFRVNLGGHKQSKTAAPAPVAPQPAPSAAPLAAAPMSAPRSTEAQARFAASVLDVAESYLNTPYMYGGASPYGGFDAGGFVQYVFARAGVRLPRSAREIAATGENVPLRVGALRPGDLVFFASVGTNIDHVAIYAGHDRIIHSTASGGGVRYDILGEGERGQWFADHLVVARRVAAGNGTPPIVTPDKTFDAPDAAPPSTRTPR